MKPAWFAISILSFDLEEVVAYGSSILVNNQCQPVETSNCVYAARPYFVLSVLRIPYLQVASSSLWPRSSEIYIDCPIRMQQGFFSPDCTAHVSWVWRGED